MAAEVSDSVANIAMTVMGLVILFLSLVIVNAHEGLSFLERLKLGLGVYFNSSVIIRG